MMSNRFLSYINICNLLLAPYFFAHIHMQYDAYNVDEPKPPSGECLALLALAKLRVPYVAGQAPVQTSHALVKMTVKQKKMVVKKKKVQDPLRGFGTEHRWTLKGEDKPANRRRNIMAFILTLVKQSGCGMMKHSGVDKVYRVKINERLQLLFGDVFGPEGSYFKDPNVSMVLGSLMRCARDDFKPLAATAPHVEPVEPESIFKLGHSTRTYKLNIAGLERHGCSIKKLKKMFCQSRAVYKDGKILPLPPRY